MFDTTADPAACSAEKPTRDNATFVMVDFLSRLDHAPRTCGWPASSSPFHQGPALLMSSRRETLVMVLTMTVLMGLAISVYFTVLDVGLAPGFAGPGSCGSRRPT